MASKKGAARPSRKKRTVTHESPGEPAAPPLKTNMQYAGAVASKVELQSVLLRSAHLDTSIPADSGSAKITSEQDYKHRYELLKDPSRLRVLMTFRFAVRRAEEEAGAPLVTLIAEYALDYEIPPDATFQRIELECFADLNGTLNVWPYWRELVHTVVARVGLGALTLPVWRAKPKLIDPAEFPQEATEAPS